MWKVGDKVVVTRAPNGHLVLQVGDKGTIVQTTNFDVLVEFDRDYTVGQKITWWLYADEKSPDTIIKSYNRLICKKVEKKRKNNYY